MNNDTYERILTKDEYLAELRHYLRKLPAEDFENAMAYFTEYFEDAGVENEAQAIRDLGTPKEAAAELLQNLLHEDGDTRHHDTARTLKIAIIAMLLSPIGWLGIVIGGAMLTAAASVIVAIVVSVVACDAALFYSGGSLMIFGIDMLGRSLPAAGVVCGSGIFSLGAALLIFSAGLALCRAIIHGVSLLIGRLSRKGRA